MKSRHYTASIDAARSQAGQIGKRTNKLLLFTFITAIASGMSLSAKAQTFAEWFSQKKTQKKYLLEQLAALQVYGGYLQKGYAIARSGLRSVSDHLEQEIGLHSLYYDRLSRAAPLILSDPRVSAILERQREISHLLRKLSDPKGLSASESGYLAQVRAAVLRDCGQQLQDLQDLLTDGDLKAGDQERIEKLEKIHAATLTNYHFSYSFVHQVIGLIANRRQHILDLQNSRITRGAY